MQELVRSICTTAAARECTGGKTRDDAPSISSHIVEDASVEQCVAEDNGLFRRRRSKTKWEDKRPTSAPEKQPTAPTRPSATRPMSYTGIHTYVYIVCTRICVYPHIL